MKKTLKKVAKNTEVSKTKKVDVNYCSRRHKIWGAVALAGLFLCGLFLGLSYNGNCTINTALSAEECKNIADEVSNITTSGTIAQNEDVLDNLIKMYSNGCPGQLVFVEKTSINTSDNNVEMISTCSRIEQLLKKRLFPEDVTGYAEHLYNAETYSTLSERGCADNSDMYKALALREIEIATALLPEKDMHQMDAEVIIDTFKKLDMQREAQEFLNKIQKLINPTTEFILQMEKVINE